MLTSFQGVIGILLNYAWLSFGITNGNVPSIDHRSLSTGDPIIIYFQKPASWAHAKIYY